MTAPAKGFTVSGGSVDRTFAAGGGVALSAAITFAQQHGTTMYVRHPDGSPYGRVEVVEENVHVYREGEAK